MEQRMLNLCVRLLLSCSRSFLEQCSLYYNENCMPFAV